MKECVREAIADTLFNLSSTETSDGPLVQLPPPSTKLPRQKHVTSSLSLAFCLSLHILNVLL